MPAGRLAGLVLLLALPGPLGAYQREEHYTGMRAILEEAHPPFDGGVEVALCAQLADESEELNAVDVYRRLMRHPLDFSSWLMRRRGPPDTVGRMVAVQQLLHALTGGRPEGVRQVAAAVIGDLLARLRSIPAGERQARSDALCALGFAFHLHADSYSHQMIRNPAKLYKTGIGHFFDSSFPDLQLISRARFELWRQALVAEAGLVPHADGAALDGLFSSVETVQRSAFERNGFNHPSLRALLVEYLRSRGLEKPFIPFDRSLRRKGCQTLADRQAAQYGIDPAPSCEAAWRLFSAQAVKDYDAYDSEPGLAPGMRSRALPALPYSLDSPFNKSP